MDILINSKTHKTKGIDRQVSGCLGPKERGTEEKWLCSGMKKIDCK